MRYFFITTCAFALILSFLSSCSVEDYEIAIQTQDVQTNDILEAKKDPYSLDVMQRAVGYVKRTSLTRGVHIPDVLQPTHKYVRFVPTNRKQVDALSEYFTLCPFPLDSIPKTEINEAMAVISDDNNLYALIDVDVELPDSITHYEISRIYDPYTDDQIAGNPELVEEIARTAYAISTYGDASATALIDPWIPRGTIMVWDDLTEGYVPISGLKVHCSTSNSIVSQIVETDENGSFIARAVFSNDVVYYIPWSDTEWAIKSNDVNPAVTVSYSLRMPLNLNIDITNATSFYAATIYRAARYYWYEATNAGFTAPSMSDQVRITCHDEPKSEEYNATGLFWPTEREVNEPNIEVWCKNRLTHDVMATTFHELGHAAHYMSVGETIFNESTQKAVIEPWADFVKYRLLELLYTDLYNVTGIYYIDILYNVIYWCDNYQCYTAYSPDKYNKQNWLYDELNASRHYNPLFIDIYDNFNQKKWMDGDEDITPNIPNDNISIRNCAFIEDIVFNNGTVTEVKNDVISYVIANNLDISTTDINNLFELYELINY